MNRPITKFYNSDDANVIAAELQLTKTRTSSSYKKHDILKETMPIDVNRMPADVNVKNRSVCMNYCKLKKYDNDTKFIMKNNRR